MAMKRLLYIFLAYAFCACDVVHEADRLIPVSLPVVSGRNHVLLEFTGFRCVNCPEAAETAASLQALYGKNLIVIALHPASNPFTQGSAKYDYTCPEADTIYRFMGGEETTSFPTGNIDMKRAENGYFLAPLDWPARLNTLMADSLWNPNVPCDTSYWLVEDSILGPQLMPDGSTNTHYYHRHVLRAIAREPFERLPEKCNPAHCSVVTIYTDPNNNNNILQAYENPFDLSVYP